MHATTAHACMQTEKDLNRCCCFMLCVLLEVNSHLYQVKTIGEELGIGFLGVGFDPKWRIDDIPVMPKDR